MIKNIFIVTQKYFNSHSWIIKFAQKKFIKTDIKNEADCFLLNTCNIREKAAEKVYSDIGRIKKINKDRNKKDYKLVELQMERVHKGIQNADKEDLIIFSDEDEIPNPYQINYFKKDDYKFGFFLQNMYFYKINICLIYSSLFN